MRNILLFNSFTNISKRSNSTNSLKYLKKVQKNYGSDNENKIRHPRTVSNNDLLINISSSDENLKPIIKEINSESNLNDIEREREKYPVDNIPGYFVNDIQKIPVNFSHNSMTFEPQDIANMTRQIKNGTFDPQSTNPTVLPPILSDSYNIMSPVPETNSVENTPANYSQDDVLQKPTPEDSLSPPNPPNDNQYHVAVIQPREKDLSTSITPNPSDYVPLDIYSTTNDSSPPRGYENSQDSTINTIYDNIRTDTNNINNEYSQLYQNESYYNLSHSEKALYRKKSLSEIKSYSTPITPTLSPKIPTESNDIKIMELGAPIEKTFTGELFLETVLNLEETVDIMIKTYDLQNIHSI